jgi:SSS family solute:Na+ symporter
VAGLVVGAVTVMIWIWAGLNSSFLGGPGVYEIIPGFLLAGLAIIGVSLMTEARGEFRPLTGG